MKIYLANKKDIPIIELCHLMWFPDIEDLYVFLDENKISKPKTYIKENKKYIPNSQAELLLSIGEIYLIFCRCRFDSVRTILANEINSYNEYINKIEVF